MLDIILQKSFLHWILHPQTDQRDEEVIKSIMSVDVYMNGRINRQQFKKAIWIYMKDFYAKAKRRTTIIRNNRNYLSEIIHRNGVLVASLLSLSRRPTTKVQNRFIERQRLNRFRNSSLLHVVEHLDKTKFSNFTKCLRRRNLKAMKRIFKNGGVVIKVIVQYLGAKSTTSMEALSLHKTIEDKNFYEADKLISQLKDEGLEIFNSQLDRQTVVVWIWCRSQEAISNCQKLYESNQLRDVYFENIQPSTSKKINIDINQFMKIVGCRKSKNRERTSFHGISSILNEIPDISLYKSNPVLIKTIRRKSAEEGKKIWINGLTILDDNLFTVCEESSEVEVYNSIKLSLSRRWKLKELICPKDIASCSGNKCLYISDYKVIGQAMEILRIDPNGILIKNWSTGADYGNSLSITNESNVILAVPHENKINEYSTDGQQIREINLSDAGIHYPSHAMKLPYGHFVVCHVHLNLHRICIVDAHGKLKKSFCGKLGSSVGQMNCPVHLSIDGNGFVLVADQMNNRVLLLDSNLEFKKEILSEGKHGLQYPRRILFAESTSRVFVVETVWDVPGLIKIFQF